MCVQLLLSEKDHIFFQLERILDVQEVLSPISYFSAKIKMFGEKLEVEMPEVIKIGPKNHSNKEAYNFNFKYLSILIFHT